MFVKKTLAVFGCFLLWVASANGQDRMTPQQQRLFEARIRPILVEHCYDCHSAESDEPGGGLLLDSREGIQRGGESGPAIVARRPGSSLLLMAMKHEDSNLIMPPSDYGDQLPANVLADFERWILAGAPDPRVEKKALTKGGDSEIDDQRRTWWAWQPRRQPPVPEIRDSSWPNNNVDHFVLDQLEKAGLEPSPQADRVTLVRRLAIDLTGLPPSKRELEEFAFADTPRPIEELVDRYLASERYGERFGRRWLDVARYAESSGKDFNVSYPNAWRYRDYVIDALNEDMPFDQFIREQLAGDLLPHRNVEEQARQTIATGFLAVGPKSVNEMKPRQFAADVADEQIDATTRAFLAVTVSCARCHDHKFDPISQRDYTAMAGIFLSTETHFGTGGGVAGRNRSTLVDLPVSDRSSTSQSLSVAQLAALNDRIDELESKRRKLALERRAGKSDSQNPNELLRTTQQLVFLNLRRDAVDDTGNAKARAMAVSDKPPADSGRRFSSRLVRSKNNPRGARGMEELSSILDSPQLVRGEIDKPGKPVPRGLPEFLSGGRSTDIAADQSGRLHLAEWIADADNPLTARVIVNRVWAWLVGGGLVDGVDNFGTSGQIPSHPDLLDHLANQFVENGWSLKTLVKEIVLSKTYQQASSYREAGFAADPNNRWLWRANVRSLDAESLRDGMLAISKRLEFSRPVGSLISRSGDGPIGGRRGRGIGEEEITQADPPVRSVYLPVPRNVLPDSLGIFDFADNSVVDGERDLTIVPSQALYWMNSPSVKEQCDEIAADLAGVAAKQGSKLSSRRARFSGRFDRFLRSRGRSSSGPTKSVVSKSEIEELFAELSLRILSRRPLKAETRAAVTYVQSEQRTGGATIETWSRVARSLFASADYRFLR